MSITGSHGGSHGNQGCTAYLSTSTIVGCQDCESEREAQGCVACLNTSCESEREVWDCTAYSNKSTNVLLERVHAGLRTHYALNWGPEVALRLSDDLALLLRVAHATVVLRGGEGALASRAETHLVEPFGSVAFDYPHPPRKKQNEYVQQGEQLVELASTGSKELMKVDKHSKEGTKKGMTQFKWFETTFED
ncbi:hypothetical protein EDD16DRAFT_1528965 [Pisolithus croceorrhizus]|nr:hypothetical protein EDD16DRAFT_1528965 [Pisolithus croceorrhizus]